MKTSHFLILFMTIFAILFLPYAIDCAYTEKMTTESLTIENDALAATQAALSVANMSNGTVFSELNTRLNASKTFYYILADNLNMKKESVYTDIQYNADGKIISYTETDPIYNARFSVPCIILVDRDGYYVEYTQWYLTDDGTFMYEDVMTDKMYWTKSYTNGNYIVTYTLTNEIELIDKVKGRTIQSTYEDVKEQLKVLYGGGVPSDLAFLCSHEQFKEERNLAVIEQINRKAEYYINTHNEFFNQTEKYYQLALPSIEDDNTAQMLSQPCVIAFVQGKQKRIENDYVNIYTYVASDISEATIYILSNDSGGIKYHRQGCPDIQNVIGSGSMDECAGAGGVPDDCILK